MCTLIRLIFKGIKDLGYNKWEQLLTLFAVTLVTFLGTLFLLVIHNIHSQIIKYKGQIQFELYWQQKANINEVQKQWNYLRNMENCIALKTYKPKQALKVLSKSMGEGMDLNWLQKQNPIPPTAVAKFRLPTQDPEDKFNKLHKQLSSLDGLSKLHFNPLQAESSSSWIHLCNNLIWPFIIFLTLLVGLIVGNTFKLSRLKRQEEIEVLSLVGAGSWYIRLPLLVGAFIQALLGGTIAISLLKVIQKSLHNILYVPPLWIKVEFLPAKEILLIFLILISVAIVSSWMAIRE